MEPPITCYRYGQGCHAGGLWIGVTRWPPRGVPRDDYWRRGYFELRLPLLAPSAELLQGFQRGRMTWAQFARRYRCEMAAAAPRQAIALLAAAARRTPVHLGCFCADPARCHRTLLAEFVSRKFRLSGP